MTDFGAERKLHYEIVCFRFCPFRTLIRSPIVSRKRRSTRGNSRNEAAGFERVWSLPWRGRWSARSTPGDGGQKSYPTGCVDTRSGDRPDRLRSENGDGVDRATTPAPRAGLRASAAAGALCGPRPDAEVRLEAETGAR